MAHVNFPELEKNLLEEWEKEKIFEKTLEKAAPKGPFVFFEGPPTANGKPGIHHVLARAFKDLIPRFKTMQGYRVERKAGWDTHGLPVELEVEKKLGLKNKKDIEEYGIDRFNAQCRESVWTYLDEWVRLTKRMAFWIDLDDPYVTYRNDYIESLWWVLSEIAKKDLLYEGYKVVPYCARCGTALSSHEVAQGYKEIEEESVYVRFKLKDDPHMYVLAWTTTPWTLPSNTALAVGPDLEYVKARKGKDIYVIAKDRAEEVLGDHEIMATVKGKDLVGKAYEPLFDFISHEKEAHRIVGDDFVGASDGSGIVHLAPFGEDDMRIIQENDFPVMMTVGLDGAFVPEVKPWAGMFVKDADPKIAEDLDRRGLLFKTEKYKHDYPFCWRCATPLLYYPKNSWFIAMSGLRDRLMENNRTINWEPDHIKEGRFGEWLSGAKDWALSRSRYWGTPLPIWKCGNGHARVIGSLAEMNDARFHKNRFFAVRHGQATHNDDGLAVSWPEPEDPPRLTETGKEKARASAEQLKEAGVDLIVASDLVRTKETAEILKDATGAELVYDERLREIALGELNGVTLKEYHAFYDSNEERLTKAPEGGESLEDLRARVMDVVLELDRKHQGKTIALVSHGDVIWTLDTAVTGEWGVNVLFGEKGRHYPETGEAREIAVPNWPFDRRGALDVHRPYIDEVTLQCEECGEEMCRVPEVLDVWFDSGAMPFAQWHYPFEQKEKIDGGDAFPADFISEAIDQTRGWFYTLLAVSTLLDKGAPYKNVICLGHILDAEGRKMSKSKGNVVDPWEMFDKHGADAIRFHMYTVNKPGEPMRFDEKEVEQVTKKVFLTLWNVLSFYKMFAGQESGVRSQESRAPAHVMDRWVLSELGALTRVVTDRLEHYDVVSAGREIAEYVDALSTWYVRRSRGRFKSGTEEEKRAAVDTLGYVLLTISKVMAPFTPFVADALYRELNGIERSVHLEDWPAGPEHDDDLHRKMNLVITACSRALERRSEAGIPVRQVLPRLVVRSDVPFEDWMLDIMADEINVKSAVSGQASGAGLTVELDTELTPELKREGAAREMTRQINSLRKQAGLTREDRVIVRYETESDFWQETLAEHAESVRLDVLSEGFEEGRNDVAAEKEVKREEGAIWLGIEKI